MDILGDAVTVMRTGRPVFAGLTWQSPWGQHFATVPGAAGIQVILRGSCWLIPDDGASIHLAAGDVLLLPHGKGNALADSPTTPLQPCTTETPIQSRSAAVQGTVPPTQSRSATPIQSRSAAVQGTVPPTQSRSAAVRKTMPPTRSRPIESSSLRDGATMTMPPGSGRDGVVLCGAYELEPNRAHPLMDELPDVVHLRASTDQSPQLQAVVGLLAAELERPSAAAGAGAGASAGVGVSALLDLLFLHALRAWFEGRRAASEQTGQDGAQNGGWAAALRDPAVSAALRAMHHEPGRGWTVAELATVGDLSRAPFARRFTTLTGRAPLAYLTWWRMTIAARMLRDSDVPLRVIAQRVGYATEFAFAAAFKRQFGTAPGRFRRDRPPQP